MDAKSRKEKQEKENDILYNMYESGMSLGEIARKLHINKGNLSVRFSKDERLSSLREERKKNRKTIGDLFYKQSDRIMQMLKEGMAISEIADILKCSKGSVYYWMKKERWRIK